MGENNDKKSFIFLSAAFIVGFAYFWAFVHRFAPSIFAVDIANDLGANATLLGLLSSVYFYTYGLMQTPGGVAIDKFGSRIVLSVSLLIAGLGGVAFSLAQDPFAATAARFFIGIGSAPLLIAGLSYISKKVPDNKISSYYSVIYVMGAIGPLVAAYPLSLLGDFFTWRGALGIIGGLTFLYAFILYALMGLPAFKSDVKHQVAGNLEKKPQVKLSEIFSNKNFLLVAIFGAGVPSLYLIYGGLWASHYLQKVAEYSRDEAATVLSFGAVGAIVGFMLAPFLADKVFKSRRFVLVLFGAAAVASIAPFIMGLELSASLYCAQIFLLGVASTGSQPVSVLVVKDIFPKESIGKALGAYNTFPLLSAGILQTLTGFILERLAPSLPLEEAYAYAFLPSFTLAIVGTALVYFYKHKKSN